MDGMGWDGKIDKRGYMRREEGGQAARACEKRGLNRFLSILNNNNNNLDGTGYPAFFLRGSGWLADLVAQDGGMECEFIPTCLVSQTR